jgi:hypothetical protein
LLLPCLSDVAAVQLVELLRAMLASIEHYYTEQMQRYHQRQQ